MDTATAGKVAKAAKQNAGPQVRNANDDGTSPSPIRTAQEDAPSGSTAAENNMPSPGWSQKVEA